MNPYSPPTVLQKTLTLLRWTQTRLRVPSKQKSGRTLTAGRTKQRKQTEENQLQVLEHPSPLQLSRPLHQNPPGPRTL